MCYLILLINHGRNPLDTRLDIVQHNEASYKTYTRLGRHGDGLHESLGEHAPGDI